jgi:adenosylcobinamide-phosphate synthase
MFDAIESARTCRTDGSRSRRLRGGRQLAVKTFAVGAGLLADAALGEAPARLHPIARFGTVMEGLESRTYAPRRVSGMFHAAYGLAIACGTGVVLRRLVGERLAAALAVAVCSAGRMLDAEAAIIAEHLKRGELDQARQRLPALAGRDPSQLDESEISRAVIESLAENGVDAVTATMFWASVGGAPAAMIHRAANTLDAMVGHRNPRYERFGWASARLDDILNFVPARLNAVAVAVVRPARASAVLRVVRRDASKHPSPNGGIIEAAFAAALDLRLGGTNVYEGTVEDRGALGDGGPPTPADITAGIRLRRQTTAAVLAILMVSEAAYSAALRRRR